MEEGAHLHTGKRLAVPVKKAAHTRYIRTAAAGLSGCLACHLLLQHVRVTSANTSLAVASTRAQTADS